MRYVLSLCVLMLCTVAARADKYYCMIFSWDSRGLALPHRCHTWGTFVHMDDDGHLVKEVTLSWTPNNWCWPDSPTSAFHMSLKDTIQVAQANHFRTRMWGPYETKKEFFDSAVRQHDRTDMQYKFLDGRSRVRTGGKAVNCIHCLSDTAGHHRTWLLYGKCASKSVVKHFDRNGLLKPADETDKKHVVQLLGVEFCQSVK